MPKYVKLPDDYGKTDINNLLSYLCDSEAEVIEENDLISMMINNRISSILNRLLNDIDLKSLHNIDEDLIPAYKKLIMRRTEDGEKYINLVFNEIDKTVVNSIHDVNYLINGTENEDYDEELLGCDEEDF